MVVDFCDLENELKAVLKEMDHQNLNDLPQFTKENATSENLARFIAEKMIQRLPREVNLQQVEVWENPRYSATYILE